ncbi:MAG: hypothetical protein GC155_04715 [Alphaproteobacteria bacterium]|nr:hypothetical protein [Alphaproteobacteria bacterium]
MDISRYQGLGPNSPHLATVAFYWLGTAPDADEQAAIVRMQTMFQRIVHIPAGDPARGSSPSADVVYAVYPEAIPATADAFYRFYLPPSGGG